MTVSTGADRWPAEVVEAAKEAVDAVLSAEVSCTCLDAYKRMSKPDPSCSYHAIAWNGGVEMLARAALAVVPPDPVVESEPLAYWHRLPGVCDHVESERGGCLSASRGEWIPLYPKVEN